MPESVDPRVVLAGERTFLAWMRTGVALMGFGFVVARFGLFLREIAAVRGMTAGGEEGASLPFGIALVVLGVIIDVAAAVEHMRFRKRAASGDTTLPVRTHGVWAALVLAVLGAALVVVLIALA